MVTKITDVMLDGFWQWGGGGRIVKEKANKVLKLD